MIEKLKQEINGKQFQYIEKMANSSEKSTQEIDADEIENTKIKA